MTKEMLALSLGFAGLILGVQVAHSAPHCAPRAILLQQLADRFGESRRDIGIAGNNSVVELFAAEGGSWTLTMTLIDGTTCLVASGQAWEALTDEVQAPGAPA